MPEVSSVSVYEEVSLFIFLKLELATEHAAQHAVCLTDRHTRTASIKINNEQVDAGLHLLCQRETTLTGVHKQCVQRGNKLISPHVELDSTHVRRQERHNTHVCEHLICCSVPQQRRGKGRKKTCFRGDAEHESSWF